MEEPLRRLEPSQLHRLKQMERENTELKKIVADQVLDIRECLWIEVDTSWSGSRVASVLDCLCELRGRPARVLTDNGPEFAGLALERWAHVRMSPQRLRDQRPSALQRRAFAD